MSDMVERLRDARSWLNNGDCCGDKDSAGICAAPACIFGEALKELYEAADEIARLREALEKIDALDVPRPVLTRYRADGEPSKYDRCTHLRAMWKDCPDCISDYASAALAEKDEK